MKQLLAAILLTLPLVTHAACSNSWVCDDAGYNCRTEQVCSNTYDTPSYNVAPIRPLPSHQIKPLERYVIPPIGTSRCTMTQVNGVWQNLCR
jgi:hypothetical protein